MTVPCHTESTSPSKGEHGETCNRSMCNARPATWFNPSMNAYYCEPCARRINAFMPLASLLRCRHEALPDEQQVSK
jgi:hypothetical protein